MLPISLWLSLRSSGKTRELPQSLSSVTLDRLCDRYLASFADDMKEASTLETERHHLNHLRRILGKRIRFEATTMDQLLDYVSQRRTEKGLRSGLCELDVAELWDCLFLRETEIGEFLEHVRQASLVVPWQTCIENTTAFGSDLGHFVQQARRRNG